MTRLLLAVLLLAGCGSDSACPSGQSLISIPSPSASNPSARTYECWDAGKPLPEGAARVE